MIWSGNIIKDILLDFSFMLGQFLTHVFAHISSPEKCGRDTCTEKATKKCNGCGFANYCGKECQILDWRSLHNMFCKGRASTGLEPPRKKQREEEEIDLLNLDENIYALLVKFLDLQTAESLRRAVLPGASLSRVQVMFEEFAKKFIFRLNLNKLEKLKQKYPFSHIKLLRKVHIIGGTNSQIMNLLSALHVATHIELPDTFNGYIKPNSLSQQLEWFKADGYNQALTSDKKENKYTLPKSLRFLSIRSYRYPLYKGDLPPKLKELYLFHYNIPILPGVLPESLRVLDLGASFSHPLGMGVLPLKLKELYIQGTFNNTIYLPPYLKILDLGDSFNQQIRPGFLPLGLIKLVLGDDFNQRFQIGVLPETLRALELGRSFNQPFAPGVLPQRLETLMFGDSFDQPLERGILPESLRMLKLGNFFTTQLQIGSLPDGLLGLEFPTSDSEYEFEFTPGILPQSLRYLALSSSYQHIFTAEMFPRDLEFLEIGWGYDQRIPVGVLPVNLKSLTFAGPYDDPIPRGALPFGLENLSLESEFGTPLSGDWIPPGLSYLEIGSDIQVPISPRDIPPNLELLHIHASNVGVNFSQRAQEIIEQRGTRVVVYY